MHKTFLSIFLGLMLIADMQAAQQQQTLMMGLRQQADAVVQQGWQKLKSQITPSRVVAGVAVAVALGAVWYARNKQCPKDLGSSQSSIELSKTLQSSAAGECLLDVKKYLNHSAYQINRFRITEKALELIAEALQPASGKTKLPAQYMIYNFEKKNWHVQRLTTARYDVHPPFTLVTAKPQLRSIMGSAVTISFAIVTIKKNDHEN